ncbi:MAG: 4Fe-4S binding protein [Coriobacteriales bacterium]|jgi:ferredoxin-type protein NapH
MGVSHEVKRKIVQIAAFGYSNMHVGNFAGGKLYKGPWKQFCNPGMNCYSCPAAQLSCPIGAMQTVASSASFGFSFYAVGFVLALGVVFGRAICGFVCPFGFLQELLHKIPSPKAKLPHWLTYLKYVMLAFFVLLIPAVATNGFGMGIPAFCEFICPVGTLEAGLPLLAAIPDLRDLVGPLFFLKLAILICVLVGCVVVCRFFCKTLCPLGALYGLLNKVSILHMETRKERCVSCGTCRDVCPMDVDPVVEPNSCECIRCGKCTSACPHQALFLRFGYSQLAEKHDS